MEKHIQTMSGHWVNLLIGLIAVLGTQVHACPINVTHVKCAVEKGAVCLDGTPPSYYIDHGVGEGANNWVIFLEGGGWCTNVSECITRAKGSLGSSSTQAQSIEMWGSNKLSHSFTGNLSPNQTRNPDFYNWNRVYVNYCDGGSFAGEVEEVDPSNNLHFRGARIFTAVVEELLAKGMKNADNVILSGQSAGGLAVMLNCDKFRALVPNAKRLKCLADGGFFIRGEDIPGATEFTIAQPFGDAVKLHGIDKFLPKSCTSKMDAKLCLYPENFVDTIQTPLFIVNGAFDYYQVPRKVDTGTSDWACLDVGPPAPPLCNPVLAKLMVCLSNLTNCTQSDMQLLQGFRTSFLKALPKSKRVCSLRGMFIDSIVLHQQIIQDGQIWSSLYAPKLKNKTISQAFVDWFYERDCYQEIDPHDTPQDYWSIHT